MVHLTVQQASAVETRPKASSHRGNNDMVTNLRLESMGSV